MLVSVLTLGVLAAAPTCRQVETELTRQLAHFSAAIQLGKAPDCSEMETVAKAARSGLMPRLRDPRVLSIGELSGTRVAVWADGPGGSGRYWDIALAAKLPDGVLGFCTTSTTIAWRNLGPVSDEPKVTKLLPLKFLEKDHFVWWGSVMLDEFTGLMLPVKFKLQGATLVYDEAATKTALRELAEVYAYTSKLPKNALAPLHAAAGEGYAAVAAGVPCP